MMSASQAIRALFLVALQASSVRALAVRRSAVESSARRGVVALLPATAFARRGVVALLPATAFAPTPTSAVSPDGLEFKEQGGVQYADVSPGRGDAVVGKDSRVTVDLVGRLVGRQGWTFENTRDDDGPYRRSPGRGDGSECGCGGDGGGDGGGGRDGARRRGPGGRRVRRQGGHDDGSSDRRRLLRRQLRSRRGARRGGCTGDAQRYHDI